MADDVLAQLDQLQRGARIAHPRRQEHNAHDNYRYDAYGMEPDFYGGNEMYGDENAYPSDMHGMRLLTTLT